MKQGTSHLTNTELIAQLTLRDDLSDLEHDLLDRLIRCVEEMDRMDKGYGMRAQPHPLSEEIPS